jgi:hypothetical protein
MMHGTHNVPVFYLNENIVIFLI